VSYNLLHY